VPNSFGRSRVSETVPANQSMIATLRGLRGNARGVVFTEPLWGIPYGLYSPYVSVYMLALGLTDSQIGLITSIGLVFQVFWALMSGAITDKLGRKRTVFISDFVSWSLSCLILAFASNFATFLLAAIFASIWRVAMTSWTCLLVEDTEPSLLVEVYSWIYIGGTVAAFAAPLGALLVARISLVPAVRILYLLAVVMMTAKFFIMNAMVHETDQGLVRMGETRHEPLFAVLRGSSGVLREILHSRLILTVIGLMVILAVTRMITNTFWGIMVTERLGVPAEYLAFYQFARSMVMLLVYFLVMPRLRNAEVRRPMAIGFLGVLASQFLLVATPPGGYAILLTATVLEAASLPVASALLDKLIALVVDPRERARVMAVLYVLVILLTSPFGWIGGELSQVNRVLPFVLSIVFYGLGFLLSYYGLRLAPGAGQPTALAKEAI
jgi:DHA1 family tetracycline resistance protein-like MFS transporter